MQGRSETLIKIFRIAEFCDMPSSNVSRSHHQKAYQMHYKYVMVLQKENCEDFIESQEFTNAILSGHQIPIGL